MSRAAVLLLAPVLLLPACSMLSDAKEAVAELKLFAADVKQARADADLNKDGKTSGASEWALLAASIPGILAAAWARHAAKKDTDKVERASVKATDELFDKTHEPVRERVAREFAATTKEADDLWEKTHAVKMAEGVVITDKS